MLKKVLFVAAVMMMMAVGCAGSLVGEIAQEFDREFDGEFEAEIVEALNLPDELTVTKRIHGDTVLSERINTNDHHHEFHLEDMDDLEFGSIQNLDFSLDDGITFEINATNQAGEDVIISADLTQGNDSTLNIEVTE